MAYPNYPCKAHLGFTFRYILISYHGNEVLLPKYLLLDYGNIFNLCFLLMKLHILRQHYTFLKVKLFDIQIALEYKAAKRKILQNLSFRKQQLKIVISFQALEIIHLGLY